MSGPDSDALDSSELTKPDEDHKNGSPEDEASNQGPGSVAHSFNDGPSPGQEQRAWWPEAPSPQPSEYISEAVADAPGPEPLPLMWETTAVEIPTPEIDESPEFPFGLASRISKKKQKKLGRFA